MNVDNERERRTDVGQMKMMDREVLRSSKEEFRTPMKRMKSGKEVGLDDIYVEISRRLGARLFNQTI